MGTPCVRSDADLVLPVLLSIDSHLFCVVSKVLILVLDTSTDDTSNDTVFPPVLAKLAEPVEVIL